MVQVAVLCGALLASYASQPEGRAARLRSLAEAERAFARMSVAQGLRKSFLAHFTEEGISFGPAPQRSNEALRRQPAREGKEPFTLDWWPVYSDISAAGDLGFNTGPYVVTDDAGQAPARQGYFFSIWRRQADGSWKVVLDLGIRTPALEGRDPRDSWRAASGSAYRRQGMVRSSEAEALKQADAGLSAVSGRRGLSAALRSVLDADARLHRNGSFPFTASAQIHRQIEAEARRGAWSWTPAFADVSASADLGYTYGDYMVSPAEGSPAVEKGSYARVWRRDARGRWRLAVDILSPWPAETK
jgi:ketosteroid isomerase-like protein